MYLVVEFLKINIAIMVILMADDKPINAMYGQKVKLDFNKIRNKSKTETEEKIVEEKVVEEPAVENTVPEVLVEETIEEEPVEEEVVEETVE